MKRFRFSLDKVQRLRAHRARASRRMLAAALSELARLERQQSQIEANMAVCREEEDGPVRALALALVGGLQQSKAHLGSQVEMATAAVEQTRALYLRRRSDLRALERLAESRRAQWRTEILAEEEREIEELSRLGRPR